ncbi:signal peptidase I [Gluconobacter wancherniae]|uniref:Signal peptidase I n=1 Tax=Gluconobacter wancherniae NBRC 103581 TaxID=656744 RepID=A0A511AWU8_9PROT|nr:signal peptidase I [Gluconobacter wancherniae]MBF0852874.1 signal peptidase I [Gluconobacter wancherniae]GBD56410.1 signal peptidase I [Gluconobacter wancherniae NBRC 103581]GBR63819.1 signal peptidase I [Gluconobacter wancherniae NBRC 103581]GEK92690.1 signal peptidase I [Gluconobacter wancherniae NBRC 103581]
MIQENSPGQSPENGSRPAKREETWGESLRFFILLVLAVFAVRSLVVEPFNIPSGSMIPTLQIGDFVLVSKSSYGYSRFSFPFSLNLFQGRIFGSEPHRGDVAVFRFTRDTSIDYIKRIVGLPGDHIQVTGGKLFINGIELQRDPLGHYEILDESNRLLSGQLYRETLPGSGGRAPVVHDILKLTDDGFANDTPEYVVPEGHFFAMGDDRDDSADSRFQGDGPDDLGFVPMQNLVGRAPIVLFSIDERHPIWQFWYWPVEVRWNRFLHIVK